MANKRNRKTDAVSSTPDIGPIEPDELTPEPVPQGTEESFLADFELIIGLPPDVDSAQLDKYELIKALQRRKLTEEDFDHYSVTIEEDLESYANELRGILTETGRLPKKHSLNLPAAQASAMEFLELMDAAKPFLKPKKTRRAFALGFASATAFSKVRRYMIEAPMADSHRALQTGRKLGCKSHSEKQTSRREVIKNRIIMCWKKGMKTNLLFQEVRKSLNFSPGRTTLYACLRELKEERRLDTT